MCLLICYASYNLHTFGWNFQDPNLRMCNKWLISTTTLQTPWKGGSFLTRDKAGGAGGQNLRPVTSKQKLVRGSQVNSTTLEQTVFLLSVFVNFYYKWKTFPQGRVQFNQFLSFFLILACCILWVTGQINNTVSNCISTSMADFVPWGTVQLNNNWTNCISSFLAEESKRNTLITQSVILTSFLCSWGHSL